MRTQRWLMAAAIAGILFGVASARATLVGYWNFDEGSGSTAYDTSGNSNNGTLYGNTAYVPGPPALTGTALFFDGNGDYVDVGNAAASSILSLTGTSYTVAWWANPSYLNTSHRMINKDDGNDYSGGYAFLLTSIGGIFLSHNNGYNNNWQESSLPTNTWTHLAVVYDMQLGKRLLYKNAALIATRAITGGALTSDGDDPLWFGGIPVHGQWFNGKLDDIRIYNEAISQRAIGTLIGINTNLVGYWDFNEGSGTNALDKSPYGDNGVLYGNTTYVPGPPCLTGTALAFDGDGDYVDVGNAAPASVLSLTGTSYTLAWWMKPASTSSFQRLLSKMAGDTFNDGYSCYLLDTNLSESHNSGVNNNGPQWPVSTGVWTHCAIVYDKDAAQRILYTNGHLCIAQNIGGGALQLTNNSPLWFGGMPIYGQYYNGALDDVRIYSMALSQVEIGKLLGIDTNLVGYWQFNEKSGTTAFDSSGFGNNGAMHGSVTYVTGARPWLGTALSFDGNSSYVDVGNNNAASVLSLTGTSYTIAWWIKPTGINTNLPNPYCRMISKEAGTSYNDGYSFIFADTYTVYMNHNNGNNNFQQSVVLTSNAWTHIAVVYDKSLALRSVYQNAILVQSNSIAGGALHGPNDVSLWFGGIPVYGQWLKGEMDDVRIYNTALNQTDIANIIAPPKGILFKFY